jgi:hypothetical protein
MTVHKLAFVSVVFEPEYLLLQLQARSMRLYLSPEVVQEIVIIDNSRQVMSHAFKDLLLADYGRLAPLVRVLVPNDICTIPSTRGWYSQQILKLAVAKYLESEWYVVLDAKNHFVAMPTIDFFLSTDGQRARVNVYSYTSHPLRPAFERTLTYLGVDPIVWVEKFTATVTPFVLNRAIVLSMIAEIELTSGRAFADEFIANNLTEFFLYSGYILKHGLKLEDMYDFHKMYCPIIWPRSADLNGCQTAISQVEEGGGPIFSIHRNALANICNDSLQILALFWKERHLFNSVEDAERFIVNSKRIIVRDNRGMRLEKISHKLTVLSDRLKRKLLG